MLGFNLGTFGLLVAIGIYLCPPICLGWGLYRGGKFLWQRRQRNPGGRKREARAGGTR